MADTYRRHCVIPAPIDDVWTIVSDPHTHSEWWPEVEDINAPADAAQGGQYTRKVRRLGFLDVVDNVWIAEPMEHLKEVNFRCTMTGTFTRFSLTPAQDDTFVEIQAGVDPIGFKGRVAKAASPFFFNRWIGRLLDALPGAVQSSGAHAGARSTNS